MLPSPVVSRKLACLIDTVFEMYCRENQAMKLKSPSSVCVCVCFVCLSLLDNFFIVMYIQALCGNRGECVCSSGRPESQPLRQDSRNRDIRECAWPLRCHRWDNYDRSCFPNRLSLFCILFF